jgi:hypothetical protein
MCYVKAGTERGLSERGSISAQKPPVKDIVERDKRYRREAPGISYADVGTYVKKPDR